MSRRLSLSFAYAFTLCLALSARSTCARAQTRNSDTNVSAAQTPQTGATAQKPALPVPARTARGKAEDRTFKDVPADSPLYAAVADLQRQGVVVNYPEGYFRGRRPLTYYEFSIAATRIVKDWDALTLAPGGKTLETVIVVPRALTLDQAQTLLNVWTEIRGEAGASDFGTAKTNIIIRTLRAYVNLLTNKPADYTLHTGMNVGGSKVGTKKDQK